MNTSGTSAGTAKTPQVAEGVSPQARPEGGRPESVASYQRGQGQLSPDDWVVVRYRGYGWLVTYERGQVQTVHPNTAYVKVGPGRQLRRVSLEDLIPVADEGAAKLFCQSIDGLKGEAMRRRAAAEDAYRTALGKLIAKALSLADAGKGVGRG